MIDWLVVVLISAFAVFRLAELVARDDGPRDILLKLRTRLGVYNLAENGRPETSLGRLFSCPYCLGVWFALACALFFDRSITLPITWLAIAGGQAYLQTTGGRQ